MRLAGPHYQPVGGPRLVTGEHMLIIAVKQNQPVLVPGDLHTAGGRDLWASRGRDADVKLGILSLKNLGDKKMK